ncbi:hypothetical protein GIB67_033525 [Kingdonia uniflora]|uniref:Uncharacterized protein n=1 Tax=Kingdonia uniflora TaxID=39325 RepID=A0A7J7L650_9MAGN|nr:hypothetical protein GIB67_033525 [Kingdonia uniflora]
MVQTRQSLGAQPECLREPDRVAKLRASLTAEVEKQSQLERQLLEDRELREKESERERQARILEIKKQEAQMLAFQTALKALQSSQPPPALREHETVPIITRVSVHERLGPHEVHSTYISMIYYEDPQAPIVSIHLGQEAQTDISRDCRPSKQPEEVLRPSYRSPLPEHVSEEIGDHAVSIVPAAPVVPAVPAAPQHYIFQELMDQRIREIIEATTFDAKDDSHKLQGSPIAK